MKKIDTLEFVDYMLDFRYERSVIEISEDFDVHYKTIIRIAEKISKMSLNSITIEIQKGIKCKQYSSPMQVLIYKN